MEYQHNGILIFMTANINPKIKKLLDKGVKIPNPASVEIGDEVKTDWISGEGVILFSGCRIFGESTTIFQNTKIGYQGPVTIENCQIGPEVELDGGYFKESVFLKKSRMQLGAHVREGSILEEQANGAHTVGLKQTILFPFATLGSLINFCDCLMAGGTSRKNHSEVGSSYIHFNFTPTQDKATPSLLGDVPRGVMLDQPPIFLGGQGGLVGPCRIEYGTITAAGTILRRDVLVPGQLIFGESGKGGSIPYNPNVHSNIQRVINNNIVYIANLVALMRWYEHVRSLFLSEDFPEPLFEGLKQKLLLAIEERIVRLGVYCTTSDDADTFQDKKSTWQKQQKELHKHWPEMENQIRSDSNYNGNLQHRDKFLDFVRKQVESNGKDYLKTIQGLKREEKAIGTQWLQGIVDDFQSMVFQKAPALNQD